MLFMDITASMKDGFGVKYIDNGEDKYIESNWYGYWDDETGEWVGDMVRNEDYEAINILDNAALCFDQNETPGIISGALPNKFTGTFMNDIIIGSSKPDTLKGGDGNDIIYGQFANDYKGTTKDKLYGDAGNDIIFASDTEAYGGTGNDIFVSDFLDGSDIISDESGYDRLSLRNRQYMVYFDIEQENGKVKSTGDIYFKDISGDIDAIRDVAKTNKVLVIDDNGYPAIDPYTGEVVYDWVGEKVDAIVARYVGRPVFEVSDAYRALVAEDPTILENFNDYGDGENYNKRYIDGWALSNYEAKEGYSLIFADWDFFVKDYDYDYHGTDVDPLENYTNSERDEYPANYLYQTDDDYVAEHHNLIGTKEVEGSFDKSAYGLNKEQYEIAGIRSILTDKENGVVIKNGTTKATAIETVSLDRGAVDTTVSGVDGKVDNMKLGDYSQGKIDSVAQTVAGWLQDRGFKSVQEAIQKGTNDQISAMLAMFDDVYVWTDDVKYRKGSYAEATSEYGGKIVGTAILEDNDILGPVYDSTYALSFTNEDRASMLSDYSGEDSIILDYNEDGYSFLFDVEVDEKGNLLNYSRDFYIKFAGEEGTRYRNNIYER